MRADPRTAISAGLFAEASAVIPGGVNSPVRAFTSVGGTPRFITKAAGYWLTDADDIGLLIALASSIPAALRGRPFLTAQWILDPIALGTPMLFDIGVFLVVTGVVVMMISSLAEES